MHITEWSVDNDVVVPTKSGFKFAQLEDVVVCFSKGAHFRMFTMLDDIYRLRHHDNEKQTVLWKVVSMELTVNRQKHNIFTASRQISKPNR